MVPKVGKKGTALLGFDRSIDSMSKLLKKTAVQSKAEKVTCSNCRITHRVSWVKPDQPKIQGRAKEKRLVLKRKIVYIDLSKVKVIAKDLSQEISPHT